MRITLVTRFWNFESSLSRGLNSSPSIVGGVSHCFESLPENINPNRAKEREVGGVVSKLEAGWRVRFDLQVVEDAVLGGLVVQDKDGRVCPEYKIHMVQGKDGKSGILFLKMNEKGHFLIPETEKLLRKGSSQDRYFVIQKQTTAPRQGFGSNA